MSRLISLSSTSRILCIGRFRSKIGSCRDERRGTKCIPLRPSTEQRHPDRKAASFSELALDENLAAHQLAELLAECQSQSGAPVFAGGGIIGDGKFLKEVGYLIRGNAHTSIDDMDYEIIT